MLRNAVGGERVSNVPEKSVTKMNSSMLLALRGVVGVNFPEKNITLHLNGPYHVDMVLCNKYF